MTQPTQTNEAVSHLKLEICVVDNRPNKEPDLRILVYPIQISEIPGEGINLRSAAEDCAALTRDNGGAHSVEPDGKVIIFPWHQIRWLRVSEKEVPKLKAPAKQTVTIEKEDVMSSGKTQKPLPPVPADAPLIPGWSDA